MRFHSKVRGDNILKEPTCQHTHSAAPVISGVSQFSGRPVGGLHCCSHQTPHSSLALGGSSALVASHLPDGFARWASDDCCACWPRLVLSSCSPARLAAIRSPISSSSLPSGWRGGEGGGLGGHTRLGALPPLTRTGATPCSQMQLRCPVRVRDGVRVRVGVGVRVGPPNPFPNEPYPSP